MAEAVLWYGKWFCGILWMNPRLWMKLDLSMYRSFLFTLANFRLFVSRLFVFRMLVTSPTDICLLHWFSLIKLLFLEIITSFIMITWLLIYLEFTCNFTRFSKHPYVILIGLSILWVHYFVYSSNCSLNSSQYRSIFLWTLFSDTVALKPSKLLPSKQWTKRTTCGSSSLNSFWRVFSSHMFA